jgi:hypothetical protein
VNDIPDSEDKRFLTLEISLVPNPNVLERCTGEDSPVSREHNVDPCHFAYCP